MNKCPFGMKKHEECSLYRRGIRIKDSGEQIQFEECAFNVIADSLENLVSRNIGLQKEMNLVRNEAELTNKIFSHLANRQQAIEEG